MRILVHDFAGHPFQVQLSRELARRGATVCHAYCASLTTTPQASLQPQPGDPPGFSIAPIGLGHALDKRHLVRRWRHEREYGRRAAQVVETFRPDLTLSANTPLDAQRALLDAARRQKSAFVYWVQDLIGVATRRLLRRQVPLLGVLVGEYYVRAEKRLLAQSDSLVLITEDFRSEIPEDIPAEVIPNWAPLDDVPLHARDNAWADEHRLTDRFRFVYSGTLGLKHNPALLLKLAQALPDADVIVVSEGQGADWLAANGGRVPNLRLLPFQPFNRLPEVLAAADVQLAILEPDAGVFSVPSKVLTGLCAARPLLLAVPPVNLVSRIVADEGAGWVVPPTDADAFVAAARRMKEDAVARLRMGQRARAYAEHHFAIDRIADRFEAVFADAVPSTRVASGLGVPL